VRAQTGLSLYYFCIEAYRYTSMQNHPVVTATMIKVIAYYHASTDHQNKSSLGLEF
jgi:hypothetical protein